MFIFRDIAPFTPEVSQEEEMKSQTEVLSHPINSFESRLCFIGATYQLDNAKAVI